MVTTTIHVPPLPPTVNVARGTASRPYSRPRRSKNGRAPTPRFVQHPHNPLSGGSLTVRNSELARTPRYDDSGDAGCDGSEASETEVPFRRRSMNRRAPTPRFVQHPHNPLSGGSLTVRNSELARTPRYDDSGDAGCDGSEASETEVPFRRRSMNRRAPTPRFVQHPHNPLSGGSLTVRNSELARTPRYDDSGVAGCDGSEASETEVPLRRRSMNRRAPTPRFVQHPHNPLSGGSLTVRNSELARTPRYDDSGDAGCDGSEASETEVPLRRRSMNRRAPTPRFVQHPHNPLSGGSLTVRNSELARTPRYDDSGDAGCDGSEASETEVPLRRRSMNRRAPTPRFIQHDDGDSFACDSESVSYACSDVEISSEDHDSDPEWVERHSHATDFLTEKKAANKSGPDHHDSEAEWSNSVGVEIFSDDDTSDSDWSNGDNGITFSDGEQTYEEVEYLSPSTDAEQPAPAADCLIEEKLEEIYENLSAHPPSRGGGIRKPLRCKSILPSSPQFNRCCSVF